MTDPAASAGDTADAYTGAVTPGGPADSARAAPADDPQAGGSETSNNAYLLTCRVTGAQLLIDAADDAPACSTSCVGWRRSRGRRDDPPARDHVRALAEVVAATGARTIAGLRTPRPCPCRSTTPSGRVTRSASAR